ncbi:hypothetical protein ACRE_039060 [Hapsidospora chrysogenum ATCC 11550]|uniref:Uncharacterized protein n=1 Tax=Hapsidospora chrysogenum (strain ATCC 11550 / CBS 779.69 / DSM 880 / IAM 14645 / JCM 23072 / IMI 49137) TaxID=857340 RepID=A0A086T7F4_HAPC1|nr:hypothetical protein ACRE_039060 [Hapsidospora chrysogenum ATCC 11550]
MLVTTARSVPRARALQSRRSATLACVTCQQRRGLRLGPWSCSRDSELHRDGRGRHRNLRYQYMESFMRKRPWTYETLSDDAKDTTQTATSHDKQPSAASLKTDRYGNIEQDVKSWSDELSGVRPGRNIEDVERELMNHLIQPRGIGGKFANGRLKSSLGHLRNFLHPQQPPKEVTPQDVLHATTSAEADEGAIDPITNRRIPTQAPAHTSTQAVAESSDASDKNNVKSDSDNYGPVRWNEPNGLQRPTPEEESKEYNDLDGYKPVSWNEPDGLQRSTPEEDSKRYKDLDRYTPSNVDDPNAPQELTPEEKSKRYSDLGDYKSVTWNEPDGLRELTPEERSKQYGDLGSYGPVRWAEPDGLPKSTPEEESKNYDDLHSYNAVRWNEPDGLRKLTPEELSKEYEDLEKYGPVRWNEPDGLPKPTPEEASKAYTDLGEYKPVQWNEPDGLRRLTPEEESKKYDDLDSYDGPRTAKDSTIRAHEASQMDATQKGEPLPPKVEVTQEDPGKAYKDLKQYGPIYWNEPDGLRKLTPEELSKNYEDLHLYGAAKWNEPDGLPDATPEEKSKQYEDVHEYAAKEFTGPEVIPTRKHPEESSKEYRDLDSYGPVRWNEPDGLRKPTPEEESKKYSDLAQYSANLKSAPTRRHPEEASKDYKDLGKYSQYDAGGETIREHPEEASKRYSDLDKYSPNKFDSPYHKYPTHPEEASKEYEDLSKYAFTGVEKSDKTEQIHPEELSKRYDDLDKYNPENFDSASRDHWTNLEVARKQDSGIDPSAVGSQGQSAASAGSDAGHSGQAQGSNGGDEGNNGDPSGSLTADEIRANVLRRARDVSQQQKLEEAKAQYRAQWDPVMKEAYESLEKDRVNHSRALTGNYVRDFPDEFSTSWSTGNSPSKSTLYPSNMGEETWASESSGMRDEDQVCSMDESFPRETSKLEPALDRQGRRRAPRLSDSEKAQLNADPYSKTPQGLETSYAEECGGEPTWPTMVKHYGKGQTNSLETAEEKGSTAETGQAAYTYKILAYDPTTDTTSTAETTSAVLPTSSPLTPADIMLQISRPAKFFPHLLNLEAEGYEMISGRGDVIVFRKAPQTAQERVAPVTDSGTGFVPPVNPVDLMGKLPTGSFASPTGFVNYDSLSGEKPNKPAPPFRSNLDAEQEEAVSRGAEKSASRPGATPKKRSLGKKMIIGTAYVAGGAYAVGAVANYFGSDGRGARVYRGQQRT